MFVEHLRRVRVLDVILTTIRYRCTQTAAGEGTRLANGPHPQFPLTSKQASHTAKTQPFGAHSMPAMSCVSVSKCFKNREWKKLIIEEGLNPIPV